MWMKMPPSMMTAEIDRKSTRLNSSHLVISYAVFCLKKKKKKKQQTTRSTNATSARQQHAPDSHHLFVDCEPLMSARTEFILSLFLFFFFFFNDTATTEIYTLSLHDALPIFFQRAFQRKTGLRAAATSS